MNESKLRINFLFLRISSLISKDQKENIINRSKHQINHIFVVFFFCREHKFATINPFFRNITVEQFRIGHFENRCSLLLKHRWKFSITGKDTSRDMATVKSNYSVGRKNLEFYVLEITF